MRLLVRRGFRDGYRFSPDERSPTGRLEERHRIPLPTGAFLASNAYHHRGLRRLQILRSQPRLLARTFIAVGPRVTLS